MLTLTMDRETARRFTGAEHSVFEAMYYRVTIPKVNHHNFHRFLYMSPQAIDVLGCTYLLRAIMDKRTPYYVIEPVSDPQWVVIIDRDEYGHAPCGDPLNGYLVGDSDRFALDMTLLRTALC